MSDQTPDPLTEFLAEVRHCECSHSEHIHAGGECWAQIRNAAPGGASDRCACRRFRFRLRPESAHADAAPPDPLTAYLAEARERWATAESFRNSSCPTALEHLGKALGSLADVPLLLRAVRAVREIHRPFGIYDECGHEHAAQDVRDGSAVATHDFLTCRQALQYEVCTECCTDRSAPFGQTENCADEHDHGAGKPICPTYAAISAELLGKDAPMTERRRSLRWQEAWQSRSSAVRAWGESLPAEFRSGLLAVLDDGGVV